MSTTRADAPGLLATQRRLSGWLRSASAPPDVEVARLVRSAGELTARDRLAVYANAWFVRIHRVLRDDFAATAALAGDLAFADAIRAYLGAHPTTSPSLRDAGARLPGFLSTHDDADALRAVAPLAPDLARLEWALVEAFDAVDAPELERSAVAAVPPAGWAGLGFEASPSLRLLHLRAPVQRVKQVFDAEGAEAARAAAASLPTDPTSVRVWRRDERVFHRAMEPAEAAALGAVMAGEPFGVVCERVAAHVGAEDAVARSAACLEAWLADGLLAGLRT